MERLGRVETWFTDHANFQRCHHTRIAVLGPDAHRWEEQLRHLWRQYLLLGMPLEFHVVDPTPEDATGQIIAQLILVQRPHVYQRSVVISTYDNMYDQGRAHSTAVVMGTRVDLFAVCTMMQAHEDCPPEAPENICTLWQGSRLFEPRERVYARHGSAFKLVIQRVLISDLPSPVSTNLQTRAAAIDARILSAAQQRSSDSLPLWAQTLHRVFQDLAETERADEGPVAYVATWYLHASYAPRCEPGRIVRLRDDPNNWQRTILEAWGDRRDSSRPASLFWVSPAPPTSLTDHVLGHILIVQELPAHSVATLLTARVRDHEGQALHRVAVCIPQASTAEDIVASFPIPGPLLRFPRRVGRGRTFFSPTVPSQFASGEGLVIDIMDPTPAPDGRTEDDGTNLLQVRASRSCKEDGNRLNAEQPETARRCLTVGQVAHTQRPSLPDSPLQVSLDKSIPAPPLVRVDFSAVHTIANIINAPTTEFLQDWPINFEIPPVTIAAFEGLVPNPNVAPVAYHLYTDGSKVPDCAVGAGIVLLTEHQYGLSFGGAISKVISTEGHAGVGENGAVIWALLWALQLSNHVWETFGVFDVHFYFHFDAVNAGYLAGGYTRTKQFPHHRTLMRSLAHVLQGRHSLSRMHWRHVKAHAGNPWNEFADALAKYASQHPDRVSHSALWQAWLEDPDSLLAIQWVWYLEQMCAENSYVPRLRNGFLECNLTQVPQDLEAGREPSLNHTPEATDKPIQIDFTIATANVLTLHNDNCRRQGTSISRQFVIMQQFHEAGCVIVGIQETRHQHLVGTNNPWYHVLGHPASPQGQDGIQLWISSRLPLHEAGPCIQKEHIRIVFACPTTLIVKINVGSWKCIIVTGRAPHSGKPRHEAISYWNRISDVLQRKAYGWPIFFCGDANAHVGECPTTAIGDLAPAQENQAGEVFHHWLLAHNLKLPATFAESHSGSAHHSYYSPDGKHGTRIDYVAVPQEVSYEKLNSWIAEDIDLSVQRTDHHAVLCHCSFTIIAPPQRGRREKPAWDSHHLSQQLLEEDALYTLHSAIPSILWHVDPHVAASQLAHHTTAALQQVARPRKTWKRKSHISDNTWMLIESKKFHFKHLRQLTRTWRYTILQVCFHSWRTSTAPGTSNTSTLCQELRCGLPQWLQLHDKAVAQTTRQYRQATQQAKQAIQEEDTAYYQNLASQAAHTYSVEGLTGVWKHFRAILPKNKGKRHTFQHDLGPSLLQHFQTLEAGVSQEYQQLRQQCIQRNNKEIAACPPLQHFDLRELPTLVEIEDHCLKQRPHKAAGPDGVPSSLCRNGSVAIAPHLHSLICKSFLLGIEPFPHKGGHLCALFKHKGSRDDAAAYRGILLADSFAKITHAWTRQKLLPTLQARRTIGQLGGLPSQQTLTGIQILRLHGSVSKAAQLSTCTIFLDLRSAFHHLLRELVFLTSDGLTERDLEQIFNQEDFDIPALASKIAEIISTNREDIPPGLQRFLHDIHHQTWFQLREASDFRSGECTQTRRGSRPGSPLADIAFNLLMAELLQDLHEALLNNAQYVEGSSALGVTVPPVAWMDDVAIPLTTTTPEALVPLVQQITAVVHGLFRARGLTLNLDKGKTEAVLCFRGPGSDAQRLQIFDTGCQPVIVVDADSHILSLRVVPSYKHLGAQYTMNIDVGREIRARLGAARQAFEEMKKPLFLNKRLPVAARIQLFQSLILSRLLYGCAVWTDVPNALIKKLETTLIAYYRQIHDIGFWNQDHVTDDSFRRAHQLPTFRQFWARHKLTFLQHIAQFGSVFHKSLLLRELCTGRGWLFEMRDDLEWLGAFRQLPFELPHDRPSWVSVWDALRSCRPWKAWIRKACAKHLVQEQIAWEVSTQHTIILDELRTAGLQLLSDVPDVCDPKPYACPQCTAVFVTHHQRALHEFRVHEVLAEERYYVQSTVCSGCLKDFHTTFRVTQHLRYRPNKCWDRLHGIKQPDEPVTLHLPDHLQGVCRLPAVRRHHGPLRPTSHHRERQRVRQALLQNYEEGVHDYAWWQPDPATPLVITCFAQLAACLQQWMLNPTEEAFHNDFFNLLFNFDIPEFQAARIFIAWIETEFQDLHSACDPELHDLLERSHLSMLEDIHIWQLRARRKHLMQCWDRLEQGEPKPARASKKQPMPHQRSHPVLSTYRAMPSVEADRRHWVILHPPKIIKTLGAGPYYVVHLYSGRRRDDDFHHFMQQFLEEGPQQISQSVLVISIDTAIDATMNVHDAKLWAFLLEAAREWADPCSPTWTTLRNLEWCQIRGASR